MGGTWGLGTAVLLLAALPYLNTLSSGFTLDDGPVVLENELLRQPFNPGRIFTSNFWGERETAPVAAGGSQRDPQLRSLYRPVTAMSYAIERPLWGLEPPGYHAVNVVLHALISALVFWIPLELLGSPVGAVFAGAVFAVHPIHTEAVASIVGRAELLAAFFFLLALRLSMGEWFTGRSGRQCRRLAGGVAPVPEASVDGTRWAWAAAAILLLYFLALGSKENAVTLPAVLVAVAVVQPIARGLHYGRQRPGPGSERTARPSPAAGPQPGRRPRGTLLRWGVLVLGLTLALAAYLALRSIAVAPRQFAWAGFVEVSGEHRMWTASRILMEYLGLMVWPSALSADYWLPEVPIARSPLDPSVMASLLLWGALAAAAVFSWRRSPILALGIGWFFVTILPVSNVIFPIGVAKAERLLYLPSVGFCLAVGATTALAEKWSRRTGPVLLLLIPALAALSVRTWVRNRDWQDNLTLGLATLHTSPTSPLFNRIVGVAYRAGGDYVRAHPFLEVALRENRPENSGDNFNLGNNLLSLGRHAEAEQAFRRALDLRPDWLDPLNNLARAQMQAGRHAEATRTLSRALALYPRVVGIYLNLGTAYLNLGDVQEAERIFRAGLVVAPADAELHFNLAVTLRALGRTDEALRERQQAVTLNPEAAKWAF